MYIYIYIYIHKYIYVYIYIFVYIYVCVYIYLYSYIYRKMCTCIHVYSKSQKIGGDYERAAFSILTVYTWQNEFRLAPKSLQIEGFCGHAVFVFSNRSMAESYIQQVHNWALLQKVPYVTGFFGKLLESFRFIHPHSRSGENVMKSTS